MRRIVVALAMSVAAAAQSGQPSQAAFALTDTINQARQLAGRDPNTALKMLEGALAKTQSDPALKGRYAEVMRSIGQVYSTAKRYPEAVRTFTTLLDATKGNCVPDSPLAEICADTYYDLGTAQMYTED